MSLVESTHNAGDIKVYGGSNALAYLGVGLLLLAFLPSVPLAFLVAWVLYMGLRQKPVVIASLALVFTVISLAFVSIADTLSELPHILMDTLWAGIDMDWGALLSLYVDTLLIGFTVGLWLSAGFFQLKMIRMFDHEKEEFFKPTPWRIVQVRKNRNQVKAGTVGSRNSVTMGLSDNGDIFTIRHDDFVHGLIVGTTGSGKSVTIEVIADNLMREGKSVIIVDLKGASEMSGFIASRAKKYGRTFHHYESEAPTVPYRGYSQFGRACYNPLARGDYDHLSDVLAAMSGKSEGDAKVYKDAAHAYLKTMFHVMELTGQNLSDPLNTALHMLNPDSLQALARTLPDNEIGRRLRSDVAALRDAKRDRLQEGGRSGLIAPISKLRKSIDGAYLVTPPEDSGIDYIDIEDVARKGEVVLFSIDASARPESASFIANYIVEDLKQLSSDLTKDNPNQDVFVIFDEFSAVDGNSIIDLLNKSRSAGIKVILATQSTADMRVQGEAFAEQLLGNISATILMRSSQEREAEAFSKDFGTKKEIKLSREYRSKRGLFSTAESTFVGSMKGGEEEVPRVTANEIMELPTGHAVVRLGKRGNEVTKVSIIPSFPIGHVDESEYRDNDYTPAPTPIIEVMSRYKDEMSQRANIEAKMMRKEARENVNLADIENKKSDDELLDELMSDYYQTERGQTPPEWRADLRRTPRGGLDSMLSDLNKPKKPDPITQASQQALPDDFWDFADDDEEEVIVLDADDDPDIQDINGLRW